MGVYPLVYGVMNRSIRGEIGPALCQWRSQSQATRGLPRVTSQRRISFQGEEEEENLLGGGKIIENHIGGLHAWFGIERAGKNTTTKEERRAYVMSVQ